MMSDGGLSCHLIIVGQVQEDASVQIRTFPFSVFLGIHYKPQKLALYLSPPFQTRVLCEVLS